MRRLLANLNTEASTNLASDITGLVKITRNEVRQGVMAGVSLGTLRRGRFEKDKVAVKIFDGGPGTPGSFFAASMKKESSSIWIRIDHPNLVPFYGVAFDLAYMPAIVYPFYTHGNILSYMEQRYPVKWILRTPIGRRPYLRWRMVEVAKGLEYLHTFTPPIIHSDVRGASIFISDDGHAMLCDYGLTLAMPEELPDHIYARPVGVARWMAPEIMATIAHEDVFGHPTGRTKQTDIYAFAMTILEVYAGLPPFGQLVTDEKGTHPLVRIDDGAVKIVLEGGRPPLSGILQSNEVLRGLAERAWDASPENRPDAAEIVRILEPMVPKVPEEVEPVTTSDSASRGRTGDKVYGVVHYLLVNPWGRIRTSFKSGYDSLRRSLQ